MPEIELQGYEPLVRQLGSLAAFEQLRPPMVRSLARVERRLQTYPPPPPDSTYQRTGLLGRTWTDNDPALVVSPSEMRGVVGNKTGYARYVQGDEDQAAVHRGRWMTDAGAIDAEEDAIRRDFEETIRGLTGG